MEIILLIFILILLINSLLSPNIDRLSNGSILLWYWWFGKQKYIYLWKN